METNERENKIDNSPTSETQQSAVDRIETPFPAQEIFPLDQCKNDGKHMPNHDELKEEKKKNQ